MKNFFVFIRKIIPEKNCSFVFIILLLCLSSSTAGKEDDSEKLPMTAEELRAYAVTETEGLSTVQYEMQQRLNLLLKANNTCLHAAEMEKLALKILAIVPDDLAAYHALVKTSILKQDFTAMSLIVSSGYFAELDQELYDYIPILEVRNIFDNFRFGLLDQSFVRQGNKQKIKLTNCNGNPLSASLSGISRNLRYPVEFLKNINSIHRLIDLREYMNLAAERVSGQDVC